MSTTPAAQFPRRNRPRFDPSPAQLAHIEQMWADGATVSDIAQYLEVPRYVVTHLILRLRRQAEEAAE